MFWDLVAPHFPWRHCPMKKALLCVLTLIVGACNAPDVPPVRETPEEVQERLKANGYREFHRFNYLISRSFAHRSQNPGASTEELDREAQRILIEHGVPGAQAQSVCTLHPRTAISCAGAHLRSAQGLETVGFVDSEEMVGERSYFLEALDAFAKENDIPQMIENP